MAYGGWDHAESQASQSHVFHEVESSRRADAVTVFLL